MRDPALQQALIRDGTACNASIEEGAAYRGAAGRILSAVHAGTGDLASRIEVRDNRAVRLHNTRGNIGFKSAESDGHAGMHTQSTPFSTISQ